MRMPFGKYIDWDTSHIPSDYLIWLVEKANLDPGNLRSAIIDELDFRQGYVPPKAKRKRKTKKKPDPIPISGAKYTISIDKSDVKLLREIVDNGYRVTAKAHHPDTGGSTQSMTRLNLLMETLREQLPQ